MSSYSQIDERTGYNLPKYLVLFTFMKKGFYRGVGWKIRWVRLFCWFGRHRFIYNKYIKRADCKDCGEQFKLDE